MNTEDIWTAYFEQDHDTVLRNGANAAEAIHIAALSLIELNRFDEGERLLTASLLVYPNAIWYANACVALLDKNQAHRARIFAVAGSDEFADSAPLLFNAGNVFTALDEFEKAKDCFQKSLALDPSNWETAMNLANTYRRLGDSIVAIRTYDLALALNTTDVPGQIRTRLNKAVTLSDMGYDDEALAIFEELTTQDQVTGAEMDFNKAVLYLKLGMFEKGWALYDRRWDCQVAAKDRAEFQKPILSSLNDARGRKILLCHEQGFGDSIQFSRYASLLKDAGIDFTIYTPQPLERLFRESFGVPVVSSREGLDYDFELPMLSCPKLFSTALETIPGAVPYLKVPDALVTQRQPARSGRLRIGIVWAGQAREAREMKIIDQRRSCDLTKFRDLLGLDADFFSLQFGDRENDIEKKLPYYLQPRIVLEPDFDFLDTAAVIKNLDMVITVDTAVAHLSAALGKPTWILSRLDGCWRWLKGRTDSPWYSPNVRLFHQKTRGDWSDVLCEIKEELLKLL